MMKIEIEINKKKTDAAFAIPSLVPTFYQPKYQLEVEKGSRQAALLSPAETIKVVYSFTITPVLEDRCAIADVV